MSVIKLGSSGWRGIISDSFTFGNGELAAHARDFAFDSRTQGGGLHQPHAASHNPFEWNGLARAKQQMEGSRQAAVELVK